MKITLNIQNFTQKIFIAYSGGMDSHVLLHMVAELRSKHPEIKLTAIHINHNLSKHAKHWAEYCQKICCELKIQIIIKNVDAKTKIPDHSPEETARKLRYAAFAEILPENACLLTAQHADDQAETVLLQLLRGAGPKGLAAMPKSIDFAKGKLMRPLLNYTRSDLLAYAQENSLHWIEDESNFVCSFDRNFIRHEIMPKIKQQWCGALKTISRAAENCAEADLLLNELAAQDYLQIEKGTDTLAIPDLLKLSTARQRNVLRYWFNKINLPLPSSAKIEQIQKTVLNCRADASPVVKWHGAEVRRYQNNIYAMLPLLERDSAMCFRNGGEKLKISGRAGTHQLKKLFQEWKVPPWMRNRIPLIYDGDELVEVVGYYKKTR